MKTGIVRKIDNLGRIVLPKELRYNLNIDTGTDFEIIVENNNIILKRYSKIINSEKSILDILNIFNTNLSFNIILIVNNKVFGTEEYISKSMQEIINERKIYRDMNNLKVSDNLNIVCNNIIYPIVLNSDLLATIVAYGKESKDYMESICNIIRHLICKKIVE